MPEKIAPRFKLPKNLPYEELRGNIIALGPDAALHPQLEKRVQQVFRAVQDTNREFAEDRFRMLREAKKRGDNRCNGGR